MLSGASAAASTPCGTANIPRRSRCKKTLRKYQRDGYRWLRTLDGYGMGGILADDMGLGKTVQVLSYLLAMKEGGQQLPSLIVCPASLVLNWQEECQKFTPQLQSVAMDGDAAHRAALVDGWAQADIVITSYDLLRRDEKLYAGQSFYACILDEAQAIKNHTTQKYKAVCRVNSRVRFCPDRHPGGEPLGRTVEHLLLFDAGVSAPPTRPSAPGLKSPSCRTRMPTPCGG